MATAGTSLSSQSTVDTFVSTVQTPVHNLITYRLNNRHTYAGVVASTAEYDGVDYTGSGVSTAGVGSPGTLVTASTVYNHLNAATYNLTHIRQSGANFYLQLDGGATQLQTTVVGMTNRPTSQRQTVSGVANGGVAAGSVASAGSINSLCTNMYNKWAGLSANRSDFNVFYCHSSCHTNCHSSRGRR